MSSGATRTTLKQRRSMHARLAKGGYLYGYHILDGEDVIGSKTVRAETRHGPVKITYFLGDLEFETAKDFAAAYEAQKAAAA